MPAFITHYLFGVDMYQSTTYDDLKSIIYKHQNVYKLGLQGPDIFFFDIPQVLGPSEFNIGTHMHARRVSEFFSNYVSHLTPLNGEPFRISLTYLCGLLCHYSLDAHVHPYVYYRTGYSPSIPNSNKDSFSTHGTLEAIIDKQLLYERKAINPSRFYPNRTINLSTNENNIVADIMSKSINDTYHYYVPATKKSTLMATPSKIKKAVTSMRFETLLLHDRSGKKQRCIRHVEKLFSNHEILSSLIVNDTLTDTMDARNIKHQPWSNPWSPEIVSTASFDDLYVNSSHYYQDIITRLDVYLHTKIGTLTDYSIRDRLLDAIGNKSYHSGLEAEC